MSPAAIDTRYEILRYEEISANNLQPHPRNPRPKFHLGDDDENLLALGDSIKTKGQHSPNYVFEIVDQPGNYYIVQGERRWRACKLVGVDTVKCIVVNTPQTPAEELEWLGIEEAYKQPWQTFFVLKFAHELALEHGMDVTHPEISAKTGLSPSDLRIASKVFKLDTDIQEMCIKYEQALYEQLMTNGGKRRARLTVQTRERVPEFPVQKAALVFEIFEAIRYSFPSAVGEYSDKDLQILVANRATSAGSTVRDLDQFLSAIRLAKFEGKPGFITELANLLQNPNKTLRDVNKNAGSYTSDDILQFITRTSMIGKTISKINKLADSRRGLGSDIQVLESASREALLLIRDLGDIERLFSDQIRKLSQ